MKPTPIARPKPTSATLPSSRADASKPTIETTPMVPAAKPQSAGRSFSDRPPRKKTGTAPNPVARAVPMPAASRTTTSTREEASRRSGLGGVRFDGPMQNEERGAQTHGRDDESRCLRGARANRARGETLPSLRAYRCDRQGEPDDDLWDRRAHLARGVSGRAGEDRRSRAGGHHPPTRRRSQRLRSRRASVGRRNHALRDVLLLPVTHRVPMLRI